MGDKSKRVRVSAGETEILSMLWEQGPLSLADAHARFGRYGRPVGYPTMQTRLNRLLQKGFLRKTQTRPAKYEPAVTAEQVRSGYVGQLLQTFGRRQLVPLVAHLLSGQELTPAEIEELKELLTEAEKSRPKRRSAGSTS
jgi:BlaI family transcriptional regulator, penicillinase repressor